VVCALPHATTIGDYRGLVRRRPWLAVSLVVFLLGLVGTPPTAVFVGKLTIFTATFDAGLGWLAVVAALNTVASVFYYLRWIGPAVGSVAAEDFRPPHRWSEYTAYTAAVLSVLIGILSGPVLALLRT
jgi:NADH-quinone oxidoreductase subunit N